MKHMKWISIVGIILILSMVMASCAPAATEAPAAEQPAATDVPATEEPAAEQPAATEVPATEAPAVEEPMVQEIPVVIPVGADVDTMFPDYSATAFGSSLAAMVYSSLTSIGLDGKVIPDLATSWEVSEDQLTWTFHLVENAVWHDGQPVTAADVKYTYEKIAHPDYIGGMYTNITSIAGVEAKHNGEAEEVTGIQVIDDYTISFTTVEPDALVLDTFASPNIVIVPEHILKDIPVAELGDSEFARKPIGSGPYKLVEWRAEEAMIFERNADYFGEPAIIQQIILQVVPEPSAQVTALLNGEADMLTSVLADDVATVTGAPGVVTKKFPGTQFLSLNLNLNSPFFKDVRVRQAIAHSIDRQAILDALYGGSGEITDNIFHPSRPEYYPDIASFEYDPAKATAMLAEAGWKDDDGNGVLEAHGVEGFEDGTEFRFVLLSTTTPFYVQENQVIQQYLKAVGIETEISQQEFGTYFSEYYYPGGPWEATGIGWVNLIGTPQMELGWNYMCPVETNSYGYCNPELDEMIIANKALFDEEARIANFHAILDIIHEAALAIPLVRGQLPIAYDENLVIPDIQTSIDLYRSMPQWYWKQ